jgi:hypothetical protein
LRNAGKALKYDSGVRYSEERCYVTFAGESVIAVPRHGEDTLNREVRRLLTSWPTTNLIAKAWHGVDVVARVVWRVAWEEVGCCRKTRQDATSDAGREGRAPHRRRRFCRLVATPHLHYTNTNIHLLNASVVKGIIHVVHLLHQSSNGGRSYPWSKLPSLSTPSPPLSS